MHISHSSSASSISSSSDESTFSKITYKIMAIQGEMTGRLEQYIHYDAMDYDFAGWKGIPNVLVKS